MAEKVLYVCPACGHEGGFWYRENRRLKCAACGAPLDGMAPQDDWAPGTTVFWKRPDGTYTLPGHRDARMPEEYIRVEAQETHEKRRISREIEREDRERWERVQLGKQMLSERDEAERRSELNHRMQSMGNATRDFARYAIQRNNERPSARYGGAFYLQHLEFDARNCEPYRKD